MSRHGYCDDCDYGDDLIQGRWLGRVASATRGKRGQAFFVSLVTALDAMPVKELCEGSLETTDGAVCALGALGKAKSLDMRDVDTEDYDLLGELFNVVPALTQEVMYQNDECAVREDGERWYRVRAWALRQIRPETLVPEEAGG